MNKLTVFACLLAGLLFYGCKSAGEISDNDSRTPQEIMFDDGNYAMFIHFGLYSKFEGEWKGKNYYGNAEWLMNEMQAGIPVEEYMAEAASFNPDRFNADEIVSIAKDAGMKYIVITSKHHEGFAMFDSDVCDFNIKDATPFGRDAIGELADACHRNGLGIGFYYSQFQDWTALGGGCGPETDADGKAASFDDYFYGKCLPQVEEITTKYGDLELIWFDTPGDMSKKHSLELYEKVKNNQPNALISSRIGNDVGDYTTLGDMEVPLLNVTGRWESVDVTQVGWGYSKIDKRWKSPEYIVRTLISTIARGGTYMLNVGPDAHGRIAEPAVMSLKASGEWVNKYPQVIYGAGPSPWGKALPWGDAVTNNGKIYLTVFEWPADGKLCLPGLSNEIRCAKLLGGKKLRHTKEGNWTCLNLPPKAPEKYASVIELTIEGKPQVEQGLAVDPEFTTVLPVKLAEVYGAEPGQSAWMEAFGEWKFKNIVQNFKDDATIRWTADINDPGYYEISTEHIGKGRYEMAVTVDGKETVEFSISSADKYLFYPLGWANINTPGKHSFEMKVKSGDLESLRISSISLKAQ